MSGYTPGPWSVIECSHGGGLLRRGEQSGRSCHVQSSLQILPLEDARLIAAAPDLLVALKQILAHVEDMDAPRVGSQCTLCHTFRAIGHAAIAKAEGR